MRTEMSKIHHVIIILLLGYFRTKKIVNPYFENAYKYRDIIHNKTVKILSKPDM